MKVSAPCMIILRFSWPYDALQKISRDSWDDSKADIRNPLRYLLMNAVASRSAFKLTVNGRKVL